MIANSNSFLKNNHYFPVAGLLKPSRVKRKTIHLNRPHFIFVYRHRSNQPLRQKASRKSLLPCTDHNKETRKKSPLKEETGTKIKYLIDSFWAVQQQLSYTGSGAGRIKEKLPHHS